MEQETLDEQLLDVEPTASLAIDDLPEVRKFDFSCLWKSSYR